MEDRGGGVCANLNRPENDAGLNDVGRGLAAFGCGHQQRLPLERDFLGLVLRVHARGVKRSTSSESIRVWQAT